MAVITASGFPVCLMAVVSVDAKALIHTVGGVYYTQNNSYPRLDRLFFATRKLGVYEGGSLNRK